MKTLVLENPKTQTALSGLLSSGLYAERKVKKLRKGFDQSLRSQLNLKS